MTRARNHLYTIEVSDTSKRGKAVGLHDFAFRSLAYLDLIKEVQSIDEGFVKMTPQQHKARGVLLVTQAIELSRIGAASAAVEDKFLEAASRFRPGKGNDAHLLAQCHKHMEAVLLKRSLVDMIKKKFFNPDLGVYRYELEGHFAEVLEFEQASVSSLQCALEIRS